MTTDLYGFWSPGDVYLCTIPYNTGREIAKDRPAVIVSDAEFNRRHGTVWVVMCSSTDHSIAEDCVPVTGLAQKSWALCDQLYSVDKTRLYRIVGQVAPDELRNIGVAVSRHLPPSATTIGARTPEDELRRDLAQSQIERDIYKRLYDDLLGRFTGGGVNVICAKTTKSPCKGCKRKPNCPVICYPRRDWERGQKRRRVKSG